MLFLNNKHTFHDNLDHLEIIFLEAGWPIRLRIHQLSRGGDTQFFFFFFFQVGVCGPDFWNVGLANWYLPLTRGGLWTENFQIWGLVSWKFPNLGACELKISKFGCLWAKIWVKIEAVEAKIFKFSQRGLMNWLFCLKWDPCELQERREKEVFRAAHPHTPFLGQCPPGNYLVASFGQILPRVQTHKKLISRFSWLIF